MVCDKCYGVGWVYRRLTPGEPPPEKSLEPKEVCSRCGGSGIIHCCDGLQAQPGDPE